MNQERQTNYLEIYRDGELSLVETYKPVIIGRIAILGKYIDQVCAQQTFKPIL